MSVFDWFRADCDRRVAAPGAEPRRVRPATRRTSVWVKALALVLVPCGVYVDLVKESGAPSSAPVETVLWVWTAFVALFLATYCLVGACRRCAGRVDG
jgi:hypothetical protein